VHGFSRDLDDRDLARTSPLSRPRRLAARSHPQFIEATAKITDLLLSKGILRGDRK
jgi:hypothetical protein